MFVLPPMRVRVIEHRVIGIVAVIGTAVLFPAISAGLPSGSLPLCRSTTVPTYLRTVLVRASRLAGGHTAKSCLAHDGCRDIDRKPVKETVRVRSRV